MEHHLKCLSVYYDAVVAGEKTFEIRKDDRGYQKGDTLILHRFTPEELEQLEAGTLWNLRAVPKHRVKVTYILTGGQHGLEAGHVILALGAIDA